MSAPELLGSPAASINLRALGGASACEVPKPATGWTTTSSIDHSRSDTPVAIAGLGRHYPVRCVCYVIPENHNPPRPSNK
jgi:hypothetical protein